MDADGGIAARFIWHPELQGRILPDVRNSLIEDIEADQRALEMAMDAAEAKEADALAAVLRLEKRWSPYDLGWAEANPQELADRILEWRWEQEKRHELFPYEDFRARETTVTASPAQESWLSWLKRLFQR